ncbi:GntR family transcriptional regulator [Paenibacillus glycanilyticus]|uniref:GntR family transcriptional regulator n=1 Tax=Paenibacillus glycanilyticus TaxID=126569 RepID=UPI003EB96CCE
MSETAITLKEKAYIQLRQLILNGDLKPGDILTERTLVEMLEMSRTPIRAALERLDAQGLAKYTPNKGLVVAEVSLKRAIDLYDYRIAIESFVVRKLSALIWDPSDIKWFEENLREQECCVSSDDHAGFTKADTLFHHKLAEISGNDEIVAAMAKLQDMLYQIAMSVLRKDRARIKVSYEDHVRIFESIRSGAPEQASKQMEDHLEFGKRILVM